MTRIDFSFESKHPDRPCELRATVEFDGEFSGVMLTREADQLIITPMAPVAPPAAA